VIVRLSLAAAVALLGCKGDSKSSPKPEPGRDARRAPVRAKVTADAAVDTVSQASAADYGSGPPQSGHKVVGRSLELSKPLRGRSPAGAPVFVARGNDAAAMIRRALDGIKAWIPKDRRVLIKVNIGGHDNYGTRGRVTDAGFVRALVLELRRRGARDIAVGDGASLSEKAMAKEVVETGFAPVLKELGVPFVNLNHYGDGDSRPRPWAMKLPWAKHLRKGLILSHDLVDPEKPVFLIDVPKIKAHRYAVMSASIKNLMGVVMLANPGGTQPPWKRRWKMHGELGSWMKGWRKAKKDDRPLYRKSLTLFSERLADLYGAIAPDLVILEGMPASQGDGFKYAPAFDSRGIVIASRNGCYADYIAAEYFGLGDNAELEKQLGVRMPPAIAAVAERYYGGVAGLKKIDVRGDTAWRKAKRKVAWLKAMAPFEIGKQP
jgi:uncharacterized protein (DUF362 family)